MKVPKPRYQMDESDEQIEVVLDLKTYDQLIDVIEDFALGMMLERVLNSETEADYIDWEIIKDSI